MVMKMSDEKIENDEDTAYDEVIRDLKGLSHKYIKDEEIRKIFFAKLEQLERLLGDADEYESDGT